MSKKKESGKFICNTSCVCGVSSDGMSVYLKDDPLEGKRLDAYCRSGFCERSNPYISATELEEAGVDIESIDKRKLEQESKPVDFTEIEALDFRGWKDRRITKSISEKYGVHTLCKEDGTVLKRCYPEYNQEGVLSGYTVRLTQPQKDFYKKGSCKTSNMLFGQQLFQSGGKYLVITTGQEDALAVAQVLQYEKNGVKYDTPVVSVTSGDGSSLPQIKANFRFVNSFDKVVFMFDEDEAGQKFVKDCAGLLSPGKAHIAKLPPNCKDPCEALQKGLGGELKASFWKAERYSPASIVGSAATWDALVQRAKWEKISLPPFATQLQEMLNGGVALSEITTIAAACVDSETEYLTKNGWKKIVDFTEGEQVAVVNDSLNLWFEEPVNYIVAPCEWMYHFKAVRGVDQMVSPNHRMPYFRHRGFEVDTAQSIVDNHIKKKQGFVGKFIQVFNATDGEGLPFTEGELRLQIAVNADGRIVKEGKDNYTQMRFVKKRKYDRLIHLCKKFNLRHDDRGMNNQNQYEVIVWPKSSDKRMDGWYSATKEQLEIIADEVLHWDGTTSKSHAYFSKHKPDVDFIQYVFSAMGRRSYVCMGTNAWECHVSRNYHNVKGAGIAGGQSGKIPINKVKPLDGKQYCFETSTGFWLARRNGNLFVTGNSSIGKTAVVNEFLYHWIMNTNYKVGIIPLESDLGELVENLLSIHIGKKLANMDDEEKLAFYETGEAREHHRQFTQLPDGSDRFLVVNHLGDVADDRLKEQMEFLAASGCKITILDPMTLALSGEGNDGTDEFMSWLLRFVKNKMISHVNVCHVRKNTNGTQANSRGAEISEESIRGAGSQFQVSMTNILLMRDKVHDNPIIRNTTKVVLSKARRTGNTGPAGFWYYDNKTGRFGIGKSPEEIEESGEDGFNEDEELFGKMGAYNDTDPNSLLKQNEDRF